MSGTFNTPYTVPLTMGCWIKYADHPESVDRILVLHKDANNDEYISLQSSGTADRLDARQSDSGGDSAAFHTSSVGEYNGVWVPLVITSETTSLWNIFVELITNTDDNSTSRDPGAIGEISVGDAPSGSGHWINNIAECAIWDGELSNANVTSFLGGTCAADIDASNLRGYWSMDTDNSTQANEGTDIGGDLTVTNAVFDADHPTITCGGTIAPLAAAYHEGMQ